jgi:hypothetical protein
VTSPSTVAGRKKIVTSVTFQLLPAGPTVKLLQDQYTKPPTTFQFLEQIQLCEASINTTIIIIIGVFFISILEIKDFQNCSIAKIIIIDEPNNAMFFSHWNHLGMVILYHHIQF